MRKLLFAFFILLVLNGNAQNYLISFAGSGASSTVGTVKVENLTSGAVLTLNGSDILSLTVITGVNSFKDNQSSEIKIYPNPMTDNATLEVFPPVKGDAVIAVCDMTGKPVAQIQSYLESNLQKFRLSGINSGLYLISVKGSSYKYSGKLLCNARADGTISIKKISNNQAVVEEVVKTESKKTLATVDMAYTTGDRLKFTGTSGIYSTVKTDIPTTDKTVNFNFIACTDGDNNNYPVVEIGTQVWMAENLKTTKYRDGITAIPLKTDDTEWSKLTTPGYCWYNNNEAVYKDLYGALYNLYAVSTVNLCPTGWHVPTDEEWSTLENYLIYNHYNFDGTTTGNKLAKSLSSTTGWNSSTNPGAVGNIDYPAKRNATGFTALPGGVRDYNGPFKGAGGYLIWRSSTGWWIRNIGYEDPYVLRYDVCDLCGFSVRCVKE